MEPKVAVLKRVALSGALDALPLDALKLYLLLIAWVEEVGRESRVRLKCIQRALGKGFSHEDLRRALAALESHHLLTWMPVEPPPSRRQRSRATSEGLEIVFRLHPFYE